MRRQKTSARIASIAIVVILVASMVVGMLSAFH